MNREISSDVNLHSILSLYSVASVTAATHVDARTAMPVMDWRKITLQEVSRRRSNQTKASPLELVQ